MRTPVPVCWAALAALLVGDVTGIVTVNPDSSPVASTVATMTTTPPVSVRSTSPPLLPRTTTTAGRSPTPAGWTSIRGEGWTIALPARAEVRSAPPNSPTAPYRTLSTYTIQQSAEGGMTFIVFDYRTVPTADQLRVAIDAYAGAAEGTVGSVAPSDVGGRTGLTAALGRPDDGPGRITTFVAGSRLFVLATRDAPVHARVLSTFGA